MMSGARTGPMPPADAHKLHLEPGWFSPAGLRFIGALVAVIVTLGWVARSYELSLSSKAEAQDLRALQGRVEKLEPALMRAQMNDSLQRELFLEIRQDLRDIRVDLRIMRGFVCDGGNRDSYCRP